MHLLFINKSACTVWIYDTMPGNLHSELRLNEWYIYAEGVWGEEGFKVRLNVRLNMNVCTIYGLYSSTWPIKGLQRDKMAALSTNYRVSISSSSLWLWSYGKAAFAVSLSSSTQQRPRITTTLAAHKPYKVHGISLLSSLLLYLAVVLQGTRHLSTYGIGYELTGYLTVSTVQTFSSLTYLNLLKLVLSYKQGIY